MGSATANLKPVRTRAGTLATTYRPKTVEAPQSAAAPMAARMVPGCRVSNENAARQSGVATRKAPAAAEKNTNLSTRAPASLPGERYGISYWWRGTRREWERFAEARNVRAGGADPHRCRGNLGYGPPLTDGIR